MCGGGECTAEHKSFVSHLMGCRACFAPNHNYCADGHALRMDNDARFIVSLNDLADRRRWMDTVRRQYGDKSHLIEGRVREMFESGRKPAAS